MKWQQRAPTNIALIKYMGKCDFSQNLPSNPSLSYTLPHLYSEVALELTTGTEDSWQAFADSPNDSLKPSEQQRYLQHLTFLKSEFNYTGAFIVRSRNNFPKACGIASSASSFAALTVTACEALTTLTGHTINFDHLAEYCRRGSGSACRSITGPWVLWRNRSVQAVELPYPELVHQTILINTAPKTMSSSAAHRAVMASLLFNGRPERAQQRLDSLLSALQSQDWQTAYQLTWHEFWDMHSLFETALPSFHYLAPEALTVLRYLQDFWQQHQDGPLVTMDAGPNIHLLFRPEQGALIMQLNKELGAKYTLFPSIAHTAHD